MTQADEGGRRQTEVSSGEQRRTKADTAGKGLTEANRGEQMCRQRGTETNRGKQRRIEAVKCGRYDKPPHQPYRGGNSRTVAYKDAQRRTDPQTHNPIELRHGKAD